MSERTVAVPRDFPEGPRSPSVPWEKTRTGVLPFTCVEPGLQLGSCRGHWLEATGTYARLVGKRL